MRNIIYPKKETWPEILIRPTQTVKEIETTVNQVFEDVQKNGDTAIKKYTKKFDKVAVTSLKVTQEEISIAVEAVSRELKEAIQQAAANIEKFHRAQKTEKVYQETHLGWFVGKKKDQ